MTRDVVPCDLDCNSLRLPHQVSVLCDVLAFLYTPLPVLAIRSFLLNVSSGAFHYHNYFIACSLHTSQTFPYFTHR